MTSPATQFDTPDFLESASNNLPDNSLAQSALESTRDAIARWTGGIHLPRMLVPGMVRVSPQARWYAQANIGFQEWLNQGGFAQPADAADPGHDAEGAHQIEQRLRALLNTDTETSDTCLD